MGTAGARALIRRFQLADEAQQAQVSDMAEENMILSVSRPPGRIDPSKPPMLLLNLQGASASSELGQVRLLITNIEPLSHILVWSKSQHSDPASETATIDIVELPRMNLSFRAVAGNRLVCDDLAGLFISKDQGSTIGSLLSGLPSALVLEEPAGNLHIMVSAIAKPLRQWQGLNGCKNVEHILLNSEVLLDR